MSDIADRAEAILNKTWHYPEDAYAAFEMLPELVTEIKRLREEMRRLLRAIAEHEDNATISHQQLAANDEEIKWLQADNKFLHGFVDAPGSTLEAVIEECKRLQAQLVKWQQIAIEERARYNLEIYSSTDVHATWDRLPDALADPDDFDESMHGGRSEYYRDGNIRGKHWWREQAAKELGLQMEQEASYTDRLERLALSMCLEAGWDQSDFEAALAEIREGICQK